MKFDIGDTIRVVNLPGNNDPWIGKLSEIVATTTFAGREAYEVQLLEPLPNDFGLGIVLEEEVEKP